MPRGRPARNTGLNYKVLPSLVVCLFFLFSDLTLAKRQTSFTGSHCLSVAFHLLDCRVGVISEPQVFTTVLGTKDAFIILASDGVWEFIDSQTAVDIVGSALSAEEGCRQASLLQSAQDDKYNIRRLQDLMATAKISYCRTMEWSAQTSSSTMRICNAKTLCSRSSYRLRDLPCISPYD